jgi:hypothetical protein
LVFKEAGLLPIEFGEMAWPTRKERDCQGNFMSGIEDMVVVITGASKGAAGGNRNGRPVPGFGRFELRERV